MPQRSTNTATVPYGSSRGSAENWTPHDCMCAIVAPEVVGLEEQEDPPARLVARRGRAVPGCAGLRQQQCRATLPAGATTTQRLPSASGVSSTSRNRSARVKNARASS